MGMWRILRSLMLADFYVSLFSIGFSNILHLMTDKMDHGLNRRRQSRFHYIIKAFSDMIFITTQSSMKAESLGFWTFC